MNVFERLYDASITIGGHGITWREIVGNLFGLASAIGGMRRKVWAWPIGIIGNALLFTVFFALGFTAHGGQVMFGQAGRQVFFILTSLYGWMLWHRNRRGRADDAPAVQPRWATMTERAGYIGFWIVGVLVCQWLFRVIGVGWNPPDFYYWADAWIFVGSIVATFAMARGWVDFWLAWLAVDLVGVPELIHFQYYPSAALYAIYAAFVVWGFFVWLRISRAKGRTTEPTGQVVPS
ncbi:nicotinamide mononucleotide transporter [Flexivirga sp. ID2601S]|uniref:Nicotinamide mononucleotide transporter n=1 Tax=Flexivirga aerilata TaxID=1656889 RepID=A0A849ALG0_9MICO|nr:nicotinamide mononucleotide transporter family protein [Flexivirga aerilata]NNG41235.1 nicotinamide mononucleotide transporter [Flexivirga aerilata]